MILKHTSESNSDTLTHKRISGIMHVIVIAKFPLPDLCPRGKEHTGKVFLPMGNLIFVQIFFILKSVSKIGFCYIGSPLNQNTITTIMI